MRAGFAGEDSPKVDIPSTVGVWLEDVGAEGCSVTRWNFGLPALHVLRPSILVIREMYHFANITL